MSADERDLDHDPSSAPRRPRRRPLRRRLRVGAAVLSVMGLVLLGTGLAGAAGAPIATVFDQYYAPTNGLFSVGAPGVLGNDSGGDAALSATLVNQAQFGTVALSPDGSFTYTPGPNWGVSAINDSFSYTATDGTTTSSATTVQIHGPSTWADAELTGSAPATAALDELFDSTFTLTNHGPSAFTAGQWQVLVAGALVVSARRPSGLVLHAGGVDHVLLRAGGRPGVGRQRHLRGPQGRTPRAQHRATTWSTWRPSAPPSRPTPSSAGSTRVATLLTGPAGTTTTSSTSTTSTSTTSTSPPPPRRRRPRPRRPPPTTVDHGGPHDHRDHAGPDGVDHHGGAGGARSGEDAAAGGEPDRSAALHGLGHPGRHPRRCRPDRGRPGPRPGEPQPHHRLNRHATAQVMSKR